MIRSLLNAFLDLSLPGWIFLLVFTGVGYVLLIKPIDALTDVICDFIFRKR